MARRWPLLVLAFGFMVVLVSCAGRGGVSVSVSPTDVTLAPGESVEFTAVVMGGAGTGVTWSSSGGVLVPSGLTAVFTAPAEVGEYTVTARSARDEGRWASAAVTVIGGAGVLLDGPSESPASGAVLDFSAPVVVSPEEVSVDELGRSLARTVLSVAFVDDATVGDVNAVLASIGGKIVDMLPDRLLVVVRVPDPGSLALLEQLIEGLEADERVRYVLPGFLGTGSALPPAFVGPDPGFYETDLRNQLAIGAHALWNASGALSHTQRPLLLVADVFGEGPLDAAFAVEMVGSMPVSGRPGGGNVVEKWGHGYKVVSVVAASYDRVKGFGTARNRPVGLFPLPSRLEVVDWQAFGQQGAFGVDFVPLSVVSNEIIRRVSAAVARGERNVIVNTSIGFEVPARDVWAALAWIEMVRGTAGRFTVGSGLEDAFLHVSAAGNHTGEAENASPYNGAALLSGLRVWQGWQLRDVPNLMNTVVVENAEVLGPAPAPISRDRYEFGCLVANSNTGGHMSAAGESVIMLDAPSRGSVSDTGTSFAAPQVAAVAQWVWTVAPHLTVGQVIAVLRGAAEPTRSSCTGSARPPSPGLRAFASLLAVDGLVDGATVRLALLDLDGNGRFDEADVAAMAAELASRSGAQDYSRFDLNGDTFSGGDRREPFDLTMDGQYGEAQITFDAVIDGSLVTVTVGMHEQSVSDLDILCFYAFDDTSGLYAGDDMARRDLIGTACATGGLDGGPGGILPGALFDDFDDRDYANDPTWTLLVAGNKDDNPALNYVDVSNQYARFVSTNHGGRGGSVGLQIDVDIAVDADTSVRFDALATFRDVGDGCGWTCREYPANVLLHLENELGTMYRVIYGINYGGAVQDQTGEGWRIITTSVDQGVWARGLSFRVQDAWPEAVRITMVQIHGSGWNFDGGIDNIAIVNGDAEPSVTYVLSSTPDGEGEMGADDDMDVYLNGAVLWEDPSSFAGPSFGPLAFEASSGDVIRVVVTNNYQSTCSWTDVYVLDPDGEAFLVLEGVPYLNTCRIGVMADESFTIP